MIPTITYHDRGDRILMVDTRSATERYTAWLPKPHTLGEPAGKPILIKPPTVKEPRRIESKRRAATQASDRTPRPDRTDCQNIAGYTGEHVGHACGGCPGAQVTSVWECSKFGDCAPLAWAPLKADGAGVRRCIDCGAYRAAA
jgi:hypothetical protein